MEQRDKQQQKEQRQKQFDAARISNEAARLQRRAAKAALRNERVQRYLLWTVSAERKAEEANAVRCHGINRARTGPRFGKRCKVLSCHRYKAAIELRNGKLYCSQHSRQGLPLAQYHLPTSSWAMYSDICLPCCDD